MNRKQKIFLAGTGLVLLAGTAGLVWRYMGEEKISSEYVKNESEENVVLYDGKKYRYNDHLSNYLFMGIDTREKVEGYETQKDAGQADALFLVSLDRAEQKLQILTIPRDTMAQIETFNPGGKSLGMTEDHINLQYAFGDGKTKSCELMKTAVSNLLYQIPIQGYCSLNMDGIPILTELVDGVEVTVPDDSLQEVYPEFTEGAKVTLTKENTEQFVRYRDITESQSALVRSERQKIFLEAYLERVQQIASEDPGIVTRIYEGVQDYMVSNMGTDVFAQLLEVSLKNVPESHSLPGEGTVGQDFDEFHVEEDALYELVLRMFYKAAE